MGDWETQMTLCCWPMDLKTSPTDHRGEDLSSRSGRVTASDPQGSMCGSLLFTVYHS